MSNSLLAFILVAETIIYWSVIAVVFLYDMAAPILILFGLIQGILTFSILNWIYKSKK